MPPTCPLCHMAMTFLYKDLQRKRSLYKCRICGYKEEVYEDEEGKTFKRQDSTMV